LGFLIHEVFKVYIVVLLQTMEKFKKQLYLKHNKLSIHSARIVTSPTNELKSRNQNVLQNLKRHACNSDLTARMPRNNICELNQPKSLSEVAGAQMSIT
jgi:hypothetical protein